MTSFQFYYQNISCYFLNLCYEARRNSITMKMYPELLFKLCSHQSTYFLNQPKIRNIQQVWKTIRMTANLIISMAAPVLMWRNNTNNCWYSSHQSVTVGPIWTKITSEWMFHLTSSSDATFHTIHCQWNERLSNNKLLRKQGKNEGQCQCQ